VFLRRFTASVQHITGQEVEVKSPTECVSLDEEIEALRMKVEKLSDEVGQLNI
jgi:diaphanous 1